jgi:hypothetical protein
VEVEENKSAAQGASIDDQTVNATSTNGHWWEKFKIKIKNLFSKLVKKCKKRN